MAEKLSKEEEMIKMQQQALDMEVDEELQREQMIAFWKKYSPFIFSVVLVVLLAVTGMEFYKSWRLQTRIKESNIYENAVLLLYQGNSNAAKASFDKLIQTGKTHYKELSVLQKAGILLKEDKKEGVLLLKNLMNDTTAPKPLRALSTIAYVQNSLDGTEKADSLRLLLAPYLQSNNPWYGSASEMTAVLYLMEGNKDAAVEVLNQALETGTQIPFTTRKRIEEFASSLADVEDRAE
jgi:hypothetical protein